MRAISETSARLVLPSEVQAPVTTTIGAFEVPVAQLVSWLAASLATSHNLWSVERSDERGLEAATESLYPLARVGISKVGVLGVAGWSFVLNNSPLGTDLGMIPSLCARQLGRVALRLTSHQRTYPATILEMYGPEGDEPLRCRRVISAANDGGRWRFDNYGVPFSFEDVAAYRAKRIRDRFTPELLRLYVCQLGVPLSAAAFNVEDLYMLRLHGAA